MLYSPICCSIGNSSSSYRVWEPRSKKSGQTLFFQHPHLMKWDWDVATSWDGSHATHTAEAVTISHRNAPLAWLSTSDWAKKYAWGVVDSFGGVNLYNLSMTIPLHKIGDSYGQSLMGHMERCKVDPFYIKNVAAGLRGDWCWNSRIWIKTWRPSESFTGKFRCIWNPTNAPIDKGLQATFKQVLDMYNVWN